MALTIFMNHHFSSKKITKKIAVIGIGNTLRSDDGIGAHICTLLDEMNLVGVSTIIVQQLPIEIMEELTHYDLVILVDASLSGEEASLIPLFFDKTKALAASHHLNAQMFRALSEKMFGIKIPLLLCSVKGENFEFGESLSTYAYANADKAMELILDWITNKL